MKVMSTRNQNSRSLKNRLRLVALCAVALPFLTVSVYGQQAKSSDPKQRADELTDWMKTNLNLTESQVADVSNINMKFATKNEELKHATGDKQQKMQSLKDNEKSRDEELKKVLTPEQFKTWKSKKAEVKSHAKEKAKQKKSVAG